MRKFVLAFLFLPITFAAQAQDKKPSKEETIQFIKNFIGRRSEYVWISGYQEDKWTTMIYNTYKNVALNNCILKYSVLREDRTVSYVRNTDKRFTVREEPFEVDLSKCERIQLVEPLSQKDGSALTYTSVYFFAATGEKLFKSGSEMTHEISIDIDGILSNESQIFKAFNHLRKLCGAPEPIKF